MSENLCISSGEGGLSFTLPESAAQFRSFVENSNDVIWMTDAREYRLVYVNPAYERVWGRSASEIYADLTHFIESIHPDDRDRVQAAWQACAHQQYSLEYRVVRPDGAIIWLHDRGFPIYDERGELLYLGGIAEDVTARKHTECLLVEQKKLLELSEAKFERLAANLPGMLYQYVLRPDGSDQFTYVSPKSRQIYECEPAALQQNFQLVWQMMHPDDVQRVQALNQASAQSLEPVKVEFRIIPPSGRLKWIYCRSQPTQQANGEIVWDGFAFDVSDRKRAEDEHQQATVQLQQSQHFVQQIAETTPGILYVYDLVEQRNIYVNQQVSKLLGYTPEQVQALGKNLLSTLVHLEDFPRIPAHIAQFQSAQNGEIFELEYRMQMATGEWRWFSGREVVFKRTAEGLPQQILGITQDISDRKQAEAALQTSEERLRMALESADLGTWDWNLSTQELKWDSCCKAMFGLSPQAAVTYEMHLAALHPDDRDHVYTKGQAALDPANGNFDVEYRAIGIEDGVERWIAAKGKVIFSATGVPLRFIGTVLNITEQKRIAIEREQLLQREQAARAEAEKVNRIKDEFLAVLSHELRSPLNPILGWSKLLQTRKYDPEKSQQALKTIERNAKLQANLIDDLLDVSRILQGKLNLSVSAIHLISPIQAAVETVRLAAEAKSIELEISLDPNPRLVLGDATRLQQVVWNLLSNAVKFTPIGGRVSLCLELLENQAQITVVDNGKGIAPEFLPYVFDYFRQADSTTTRTFGGLGLGLAIVRQIVELHGGSVWATSSGEDLGASFTVQLPLKPMQPPNEPVPNLRTDSPDLSGVQVLVVDDDADARDLIAAILDQFGAGVRVTTSAQEALATLKQFTPDVLVCDIGMPDVDGYMLLEQIRALPPGQGGLIPAIALTAYAGDFNQQQALQAGFQQHITKPVELEEVITAILIVLQESRENKF